MAPLNSSNVTFAPSSPAYSLPSSASPDLTHSLLHSLLSLAAKLCDVEGARAGNQYVLDNSNWMYKTQFHKLLLWMKHRKHLLFAAEPHLGPQAELKDMLGLQTARKWGRNRPEGGNIGIDIVKNFFLLQDTLLTYLELYSVRFYTQT